MSSSENKWLFVIGNLPLGELNSYNRNIYKYWSRFDEYMEIKIGSTRKKEESDIFADIIKATSKYYFKNSIVDVYNQHIVYHNICKNTEKTKQNETIFFFKSKFDFKESDKLLILKDLRDKYYSRKKIWAKVLVDLDVTSFDIELFFYLGIYEIEEKFKEKISDLLEQELNEKLEDYDDGIKFSKNVFFIDRKEPWIKIVFINKDISIDKIEDFIIKLIDNAKNECSKFKGLKEYKSMKNSSKEIKTKSELFFKKLYPYENSTKDVAYIIQYQNNKLIEFPMFGVIFSTVGE